jgi:hypothetical protein
MISKEDFCKWWNNKYPKRSGCWDSELRPGDIEPVEYKKVSPLGLVKSDNDIFKFSFRSISYRYVIDIELEREIKLSNLGIK